MTTAPVNRILPYSVVDGPGCRAAVFFQKCNIHCAYCHNPETQNMCTDCGACVASCPAGALRFDGGKVVWDESKCKKCDTCIKVCPNHASPRVTVMTPVQVFDEICRSIPFIRGVTVSGGECSLYPEFAEELFRLVRGKGLTCLMDCNGTIDMSLYGGLMDVCDGVMLDVKAWDDGVFRRLTGFGNGIVKKNLAYLYGAGKLTEVRIVVLPGWVDAESCIDGTAGTLGAGAADVPLKLIRFRRFGVKGELRSTPSPDMELMRSLRDRALGRGFRDVRIL